MNAEISACQLKIGLDAKCFLFLDRSVNPESKNIRTENRQLKVSDISEKDVFITPTTSYLRHEMLSNAIMKAYNSNGVSPGINNDERDELTERNSATRRLNF